MRKLLVFALMLTLVGTAMAIDLGTEKPAKPAINYPENVPNPLLQGGDTILSAVPAVIGNAINGTTSGYVNDYDEVCPYTGSTAPDVVYVITPAYNMDVVVDLGGSSYDTKTYIYDQDLNLVGCNDDFYSDWTSRLMVPVVAGVQYYVIIDGYGSSSGVYTGYIQEYFPCDLICPAGAQIEGEPALVDGYVDNYNGGCNTSPAFPFQTIDNPQFCGKTGYYMSASGASSRDTDWFYIEIPDGGVLEVTGDAEENLYMFELGPQNCGSVAVIQSLIVGPCAPGTLTILGTAGSIAWYWAGPTHFWEGDTYEYEYILVSNIGPIAVENHSWTGVKSLFN
ncbi:MAG TPA: hypothetical protein PLL30_12585 [Candidatus Krumholzibacteria bacterium]|nr:hypothetical protein [Candidatus Krumholzibacteria bacterium]HPD72605.1 hypothetical protein [Candidatus Krumholzibacteria bacterium]HRY40463.1 hypothetical protein [Candidatus Krumholzibacteria bacterium]